MDPNAQPSFDLTGLDLLVVEDETDSREILVLLLQRYGATATGAESVAEALQLFDTVRPHVVISDLRMPFEDGYALVRHLRSRSASDGGTVPVIALSAHSDVDDRLRTLSSGFQAHLAKPVNPAELAAVVRVVARAGAAPVVDAPATPSPSAPAVAGGGGLRLARVEFDADALVVHFEEGRTTFPLEWFPALRQGTDAQRNDWRLGPDALQIQWPSLGTHVTVAGLFWLLRQHMAELTEGRSGN